MPKYPLSLAAHATTTYPGGLSIASTMVPMSLTGALGLSIVWSLCINPRPRYGCELALVVAGCSQFISLFVTSSVAMIIASPPRTVSTTTNVAMRMIANWTHLLAVVVTTYICYRRAQAIWVASPRAAQYVAPVVSLGVVTAAIASRVTGTINEIGLLNGITTEDPWLFSAQQFTRAYVNFTAGVFALFSEAYVTMVIAQFRLGSATAGPSSSSFESRNPGKLLSSKALLRNRVRLAYAVLICTTFLVQSGLQVATMLRVNRFAPFHSMGWSLVIIRIFEFRSELLSPTLSRPLVARGGGGDGGLARTLAASPSASVVSFGLTRDASISSARQVDMHGATNRAGALGVSGSGSSGGIGRMAIGGGNGGRTSKAHSNMAIV
ncbi:hypothetical protein BCR44DRAFT_41931 [Catenaria anguillulae PL171]|uniref:Uncharacterized protein n=1 Tax=Catenaria anguillulae PL171 TaxID=765915 RepID=A0A1Y2HMV5_9FUNG|nr:hypothetical protein BCR44DRAFT_41931 [Catenaria anguillulae PL171]